MHMMPQCWPENNYDGKQRNGYGTLKQQHCLLFRRAIIYVNIGTIANVETMAQSHSLNAIYIVPTF